MSRRLELLVYGLAASLQVLVAWLVYSHHFNRESPPSAVAAVHAAAPAGSGSGSGLSGSQSSKRHF